MVWEGESLLWGKGAEMGIGEGLFQAKIISSKKTKLQYKQALGVKGAQVHIFFEYYQKVLCIGPLTC